MKISKWIASVLVVAMLLSMTVMPGFHIHAHATTTDEPTITVGSVEGKPGETIQVPVEMTNNPGVLIVNSRVWFDDTAVEVKNSYKATENNPLANSTFIGSQVDGTNPVSMYWESSQLEDMTGDGIIGYVEVTIKEDAQPGTYEVYIVESSFEAFNISLSEVEFNLVAGAITVVAEPCETHTWGEWETVTAADCLNDGKQVRTCSVCGASEEDALEALGHSFTNYVSNEDAGCEVDGTETAQCDRCDATDTRTAEGSAKGHSFVNYVSDENATCVADGTETAVCENCDATDTRTVAGSKEEAEHSFPAEYTSDGNATCTADGTKSRLCVLCGEKETVTDEGSALGHDFTEQTTDYLAAEADCCHKAVYYYSCANDGCDEKGTETFAYGDVDPSNHVGGTEIRDAKEPTEDAEGYTGDTYCLGCGVLLEMGRSIPKTDHVHDLVKTEAKDASCESDGNTAYWTCSKCGKLYADANGAEEIAAEDTVVEALGHSFTDYVSDGNATCWEDGTKTAQCDRCDATDTVTDENSKLEHNYGEWTVITEPTCTETGVRTRNCANCLDTEIGLIDALGHSFTNYISDGNATCETDGTETAVCDRCDATDTRADDWSALGHDFTAETTDYLATAADCCHKATYYYTCANGCGEKGTETFAYGEVDLTNHVGDTEVRGAVAPTEDAEGYTGDTYCLGCGTMIEKGQSIPKADHVHNLVKTEAVAATCTEEGSIAYWTCTKCGELYADANGAEEITADEIAVAALGHSFTNYVSDGNAACETNGTKTAKCDRCDATDTVTDEGSALGHSYGEWTVTTAPTCTEAGEETSTCAACGETETRAVDALGHSYGEWTVTTAPTCTEAGEETSTCVACGETETRAVDALGHSYGEWIVTTAPTCTEEGEQIHTCTVCDAAETEVIAALGHDYESVVTDPTETEKGYTTHVCKVCAESYVDSYVDPKPDLDNIPQTGDAMNGGLWMGMMVLCLMGTGVLLTGRKKWLTK